HRSDAFSQTETRPSGRSARSSRPIEPPVWRDRGLSSSGTIVRLPLQGGNGERRSLTRTDPARAGEPKRLEDRIRFAAIGHDQHQVRVDRSRVDRLPSRVRREHSHLVTATGIGSGPTLDLVSRQLKSLFDCFRLPDRNEGVNAPPTLAAVFYD